MMRGHTTRDPGKAGDLEGPPGSISGDLVVVGGPVEPAVKDNTEILEGGDCVYVLVSNRAINVSMQEGKVQGGYISV